MRLLALLAGLFVLTACGSDHPDMKLNNGDPAPQFSTVAVDGTSVAYPATYAGKPLVIRFWADWCKYCAGEMQAIEQVYRRHQDKGLAVVAINTGQDRATIAAFAHKVGFSYPTLLDETSAITKRYGVVGLPTTYFVDAQGIVRGKIVGEADEVTFERQAFALFK
ncbi:TlpA family protein disulfide reductase [Dechloromonas denitrificans]|uniref:TlpA family protein disulfide reductase n=1 Tax=Dechloromonas denitrificans TaxID=281362 RepID=UPI001CF8935F|nr:TlpA disulfide reductase family protein [Dechloromonas denitrificans]UCV05248.1 TlpA family protein disulfide reductase [Dechloromonas denitrificans]